MFRKALVFFTSLMAASAPADKISPKPSDDGTLRLMAGDVITQRKEDAGNWRTIKILAVDNWPDGSAAAHCLIYQDSDTQPALATLASLQPRILHAPIAAQSFATGWLKLGNVPVKPHELEGFHEYLKLTDFPRYLKETGQDPNAVVADARQRYLRANSLAEAGKRKEAIEEYGLAIDIFPLFYEAIDNRAFTYMELGDYRSALGDFEASLRVEPNGMAAFFSRGECLMKLGQLDAAEAVFQEGVTKFPQHRKNFETFLERTRALKKAG